MTTAELRLEGEFIAKLRDLKYEYRPDIRDRSALEKNFREKFQALNHVRLTDAEFQRLLRARGVNAHIRASRGRDIAAACGQLAGRVRDRQRVRLGDRVIGA